jgi:PEP-CTERM motif
MASAFRNILVKMFLICSACLLGWVVPSAVAGETYTYIGNNYNLCSGSYVSPCSQYHITGSFTTTLDLFHLQGLTNFVIPTYDIASFSFVDGSGLTINQSNARTSSFEITTNSFGNITSPQGWDLLLVGQTAELSTSSCDIAPCIGAQDWSQTVDLMGHATDAGYAQGAFENPGVWDGPAPVPTPEPSTLFLFGTGLLGLMGMSLRKKRIVYFHSSSSVSSEK